MSSVFSDSELHFRSSLSLSLPSSSIAPEDAAFLQSDALAAVRLRQAALKGREPLSREALRAEAERFLRRMTGGDAPMVHVSSSLV